MSAAPIPQISEHIHNVLIQRWRQWACFVDNACSRTKV